MKRRHAGILFLLLLSLALALAGCGVAAKGRKPSPDWSRGLPLGSTNDGSLALAVAGSGEEVFLVWPASLGQARWLQFVRLDASARPVVDRELPLSQENLRTPRLVMAAPGQAHLFWISRPEGDRAWQLWHAWLDGAGELAMPAQLSAPARRVGNYVAAPDGRGGANVVWEDVEDGLLMAASVDASGQLPPEPFAIGPGHAPDLRLDQEGNAHLVWLQQAAVRYAAFPGARLQAVEGLPLFNLAPAPSETLSGPALGVTPDYVYLAWGLFSASGLEAGTARVEYLALPRPVASSGGANSSRLWLPLAEEPAYGPVAGSGPLSQLAPPGGPRGSSDYVYQPVAASSFGHSLAVALQTKQTSRLDQVVQVAVALFEGGRFVGYVPASKTEALSQDPVLALDDAGNLHLAWREGGLGRLVYYATTAPQARAALDRFDFNDLGNLAASGGLEALVGMMFFPLACLWLLPGLGLLGWRKLRRDDDRLDSLPAFLLMGVAVLSYQVVKLLFLPTVATYVPFSAWVDVPPGWQMPLRLAVPALILAAAGLLAWRLRRRTQSALLLFLALAGSDALLTLAIYGVGFLGVF